MVVPNDWELQPRPGMSVFQTTFSVSLHVSGKAGSSATAPAAGPRNWDHWPSSAAKTLVKASNANPKVTVAT